MAAAAAPSPAGAAPAGAAAPPRQHHIPELLEIHADELAYLWGQRRAALFDVRYTQASFLELNERIDAHVAGLLTVPSALPALLGPRLSAATDRDEVFAAACGLLRLRKAELTARVGEMFAAAAGPQLLGLRDALATAPRDEKDEPLLRAMLSGADPARAVAAASVLAQHERLHADDPQLDRLALDADANVAAQAWRVLRLVDAPGAGAGAVERPFPQALQRTEPALRQTVLACAAWTAQPWLHRALRLLVNEGDLVALGWLAVLGGPPDDAPVQAATMHLLAPRDRPALLGRSGRPWALPLLRDWMYDRDTRLAAAAAEAYRRLTGEDLRGRRVTPRPADDADDFEREMAAAVWLPDLDRLEEHYGEHRAALAAGGRWNRGIDLGDGPSPEALQRIDLPARWDAGARAAHAGRPIVPPPPLF